MHGRVQVNAMILGWFRAVHLYLASFVTARGKNVRVQLRDVGTLVLFPRVQLTQLQADLTVLRLASGSAPLLLHRAPEGGTIVSCNRTFV